MAYIAARIQLVVKRRMKLSNLPDVGHILRRKGTSTKMRVRPETLCAHRRISFLQKESEDPGLHREGTEDDPDRVERKNASDTSRETQNNGYHTSPEYPVKLAPFMWLNSNS